VSGNTASTQKITSLLLPRHDIEWKNVNGFLSPWARPVLIENKMTRELRRDLQEQEQSDRDYLTEMVEEQLAALPSIDKRFWLAEFRFMAKILRLEQLCVYMPAFVQLAMMMPRSLIYCRREAVRLYLDSKLDVIGPFSQRQQRKFIRSSVLVYPSHLLFSMSELFVGLLMRSMDQSAQANRRRVLMSVRSLQLMSREEISIRFKKEEEYLNELEFLKCQCEHYKIRVPEIYAISVEELNDFWETLN
jgi:hypothetical protein